MYVYEISKSDTKKESITENFIFNIIFLYSPISKILLLLKWNIYHYTVKKQILLHSSLFLNLDWL